MPDRTDPKAVVVRYFEDVWNARQLAVIDELLRPNFLGHERNAADTFGRIGMHGVAETFFQRFPDAVFTILDTVAEGDQVMLHLRLEGTHQETGRPIVMSGMALFRVVDGGIAECWSNYDELGMLQQLGGRVVFETRAL
jgi:predicted ester cyclase